MTDATAKKARVAGMFNTIAPTYDVLNGVLSLGIDRIWRRRVVRMVARATDGKFPHAILDVATGTGDLALALARKMPGARVVGIDISERMLDLGRQKIEKPGKNALPGERITLQTGDAEALEFADGEFDRVTVGFGVRNFGDIPAGLREMRRVLKEGGRCFVLEFSEPRGAIFGRLYRFYFHRVLPRIGRIVSRDDDAYSYLPRSVAGFPTPERFADMLREAGFESVRIRKLTFGVAYVYEAVR